MATKNTNPIVDNDPAVNRQTEREIAQAGIISQGKPSVVDSETVFPMAIAQVGSDGVTIKETGEAGDIVTVKTSGSIYVNSIDQTINQVKVMTGVNKIIAGNNITVVSTPTGGVGNVTVSANVGNVALVNLDGNVSNVLRGDGTWGADANSSYGNSNVTSLLGSFGSNTITTTGLITGNGAGLTNVAYANLTGTPSLGNIASINLDGNASNVLRGNGTFGPDANSSYGDSNVTSLLGAFGSNTIVTTGIITADGANLSNVPYSNLTGAPTLGNIASINLDGNSQTWLAGNGVFANIAIPSVGNIATINLDGSSSNILYGNGVFAAAPSGGGLPLSNGNSNINIATANGNVTLTSAGNTWTVGTDGSLTAPNNSNIYPAGNNFNVYAPAAGAVQFYTDGGNYSWSLDGFGVMNLPFASAMSNTALVYSAGNLRLDAGANNFMFTDDGNLYLAGGNSYVKSVPNNAGDGSGLSTLNLYPDSSTGDDRYLIVDPTGPNHIHIRAGGVQDGSNSLLFLGGEQAYVQIDDTVHEVQIGAYDNANAISYFWRFENDGTLTLPGNLVASGASPAPTLSGFSSLTAADSITVGNANVYSNGHVAADTATFSGNISALNIGNAAAVALDGNVSNVLTGNGTFVALPVINANTVVWSTAPVANTSNGSAGQAAYDSGGNLYVCVATDTWAKFTGTTSW